MKSSLAQSFERCGLTTMVQAAGKLGLQNCNEDYTRIIFCLVLHINSQYFIPRAIYYS